MSCFPSKLQETILSIRSSYYLTSTPTFERGVIVVQHQMSVFQLYSGEYKLHSIKDLESLDTTGVRTHDL